MVAGRELNERVAVEIMGLVLLPFKTAPCPYCGDGMRFCGARSWCSTCREWRHGPAKEYSTDIAAAWEVVEKMRADGWFVHIDNVGFNNADEGKWRVFVQWFSDDDDNPRDGESHVADGPTAPQAICLAALKACGVEVA